MKGPSGWLLTVFLVGLGAACPGLCLAQAPVVATVCVAGDVTLSRDAAEICGHLNAMVESRDLQPVPLDRFMVGEGSLNPFDEIAAGRRLVEEGASAFEARNLGLARRQLSRGLELLIRMEPYLAQRGPLEDALLWNLRAATSANLARAARQLLNFSPQLRLEWAGEISDEALVAQVNESLHLQKTTRPGGVEVQASPPLSEVFLNGVFVGVSPVRLEGLPVGEHLLRVRRDGYEPQVAIVDVAPGRRAQLDIVLKPTKNLPVIQNIDETIGGQIGDPRPGKALSDLKALLLIEQAISVKVSRQGEEVVAEAFLYDMRSMQQLRASRLVLSSRSFASRRASAQELLGALSNLGSAQIDNGGVGPSSTSLLDEWWFWPGVGVAAAGVLSAVLIVSLQPEEPTGQGGILLRFGP